MILVSSWPTINRSTTTPMNKLLIISAFCIASLSAQSVRILAPVFQGSGLNDVTSGGVFTALATNATYTVTIGATGTPDHFTWTINGSAASAPIAITGAAQALSNGVTVTFGATTGHRIADAWKIRAVGTGNTTPYLAGADGAVARTMEAKLREIPFTPLDFGPPGTCSGPSSTRDDTAAIQAAIDAAKAGTVLIPDKACTTTGNYLYRENAGITVLGSATLPSGTYVPGSGGGLVALTGSHPDALLTNMAANSHLRNILFDGNNGAAAHGLVDALSILDTEENLIAIHFSGDGFQVNASGGMPGTTLTASTSVGETGFHIAAATNKRIKFGVDCPTVTVGFGTANHEVLTWISTAGLVLTLSAATRTHASGDPIGCFGNADLMHISHSFAWADGGWGMRIVQSGDNSGIFVENFYSRANALGGIKWCGSVNKMVGGSFEGDSGPAVQLGGSDCLSAFGSFGPLADAEEATNAYSAIQSVCSSYDQVQFTRLSAFSVVDGCGIPTDQNTAMGFGTDGNQYGNSSFWLKNRAGVVPITVAGGVAVGRCEWPGGTSISPGGSQQFAYCLFDAGNPVSATTNGISTILTTISAPSSGYVYIYGYTGACSALNGPWNATNLSSTTFSIPANSTNFGTCTGAPNQQTNKWSAIPTPLAGSITINNTAPAGTGFSGTRLRTVCTTINGGAASGCSNVTETYVNGLLQ